MRHNGVCNPVGTINKGVDEVLTNHIKVFANELDTLKGYKAKLNVDPTAMPRFCKARTVPYALKPLVESELNRLESEGIISPVQFSHWAAPIVPIIKKNGILRICGDYKVTVNRTLQVDSYPLPRVEELFASLSGGKYFIKLDKWHWKKSQNNM